MRIAYRIMACYERQEIVDGIVNALELQGADVKVFYDDRRKEERKGTSYTQLKCIADALDGEYSHLCLLQDDIELVDRFDDCVKELIQKKPMAFWTLFCTRLKREDMSFNSPYAMLYPANTWGQGNLIETGMLRKILLFRNERLPNYIYDDGLYLMYCTDRNIPVYTTRVALLQHLCPTKSLLGYNNKLKTSKVWAGKDRIYERMNWSSNEIKKYSFPMPKKVIEEEYRKYGPRD